ncbi:MAG: helix-turn-helix transcriptional regulator [Nostoc sp.]|uniref:helix-turn-helix transcriptional regulator n=1 Tax=Nostoc sp. TaxID=1180 RepID=UPI002FFBBFD5
MLSEALRLIRVFYDLTQKELAEKLGISKSYLSEIESGKKTPTLELLNRYSEFFDIPASSIMFFSESLNKDIKTEKLRAFVSSKILAILNFIAERSGRSYAEE